MSVTHVLQLYRGPRLELRFNKRQGSPFSISLAVDATTVMHANPSDFRALKQWLEDCQKAVGEFIQEPEDPTVTDNLRGDSDG